MSESSEHILLAIHERLLADVTQFRLRLLGYDVICVVDGASAMESLDERIPQLAIVRVRHARY
jgi:DNA-binding response OmpR family regulator